jgi:hypothetical protein
MKLITFFSTTEPGENVERYLEGKTCKKIEVFSDGSVIITVSEVPKEHVITFVGLPYKLEELTN